MELISVVFDHLYARHEKNQWEPLVKDPISKSLLPFVRQNLFKKLPCTLNRFLDFCEMVKGTNFIAGSVQELEVTGKRIITPYALSFEDESSILAFFASAQRIIPKALDIEKILTTTRPKSLKLLSLAHITYTDADDDFLYSDGEPSFEEVWEEEIPEWSRLFSFADAKSLRELAKVEGVKLGSKFYAALKVQVRYARFIRERDMMEYYDGY